MRTFFLGEVLMRLEAPDHLRFIQTDVFHSRYTGAELNSAVLMHCLGAEELYLISAFPDNALGEAALNAARHWQINTAHCIRKPGRLGVFFLEQGFGMRPSSVIYDRAGSVFAQSRFEDYDFESIFAPGDWLYVSGTMPALSEKMPEFLKKVFSCARRKGCTVCLDLNYRANLWSWEKASAVFTGLLDDVDILLGNAGLARAMFKVENAELCEKFQLKNAALTCRKEESVDINICSASLYGSDGEVYHSRSFQATMLDRIGGGDAFGGAIIYALQRNMPGQAAVDFAVAAQILKQTVRGDFGLINHDDIQNFLSGKDISVRR